MELTLPYKYAPRPYQVPFLRAMDDGKKRAILVWHRKSGKEKTCWNYAIRETQERVGNYWYLFPYLTQARKVIWEGIDQDGVRFLDHIPKEIIDGEPNSTSMMVKFRNGSTLQLIGCDTLDTSIGGNPVGVVFSEYSLSDPLSWTFIRPILANNGGWAIFNYTPRGENHAYDLFNMAKDDPENWFCEIVTVDDTKALSLEVLAQEKKEIMRLHGNDSLYRQEYFCDFSVPIAGAYYADQIMKATDDERICNVPHDPRYAVDTWWDLGRRDFMAIWFTQSMGPEMRVIDFYQKSGEGFPHFARVLKEKKYIYGRHVAPHDIEVTEMSNNKLRRDAARDLGIDFEVCPKIPIADGIDAVRSLFPRCWFDKTKCQEGLNALKNYHKQWDDKRKTYLDMPYHDWSSDAADAFRTLAVGSDYERSKRIESVTKDRWSTKSADLQFNPMLV